jgi:hypothetical protein
MFQGSVAGTIFQSAPHRPVPLDRNAKARLKMLMQALMRRTGTEPGRACVWQAHR